MRFLPNRIILAAQPKSNGAVALAHLALAALLLLLLLPVLLEV